MTELNEQKQFFILLSQFRLIQKKIMQLNKKILKKVSKKNKAFFSDQIPHQVKLLESFIKGGDHMDQINLNQILTCLNMKCLLQYSENVEDTNLHHIIKQMKIKYCREGQKLLTFRARQQQKQTYVLLKGEVSYKFMIDNKQSRVEYPVKVGQLINLPYPKDLQFRQFSLVCNSPSIFLEIAANSIFREYLIKDNQQKLKRFLNNFQKYNINNDKVRNYSWLIPYFSSSKYLKKQIIYPKTIKKSNYFCYISEGEVQLIKKSTSGKEFSMVQIPSGQFFDLSSATETDPNIILRCKNIKCEVICIPLLVLQFFADKELKQSIKLQSKNSTLLHLKMFQKNNKILADPLKMMKFQVKNKGKKKKLSKLSMDSWDLISHVASQMKMRRPTSFTKTYSRSAHSTPRNHQRKTNSSSQSKIDRLKNIVMEQKTYKNNQQAQKQNQPLGFRTKLKSTFNNRSKYVRQFSRTINTADNKAERQSLMKKAKFKLLRYAKGNNLYGLNDYF